MHHHHSQPEQYSLLLCRDNFGSRRFCYYRGIYVEPGCQLHCIHCMLRIKPTLWAFTLVLYNSIQEVITLTLRTGVSQKLSLTFSLGPAVSEIGVSTVAVLIFTTVSPGVDAAGPLPDGQDVTRYLALVNSELARSIFCALPLLQERERERETREDDFLAAFQTPAALRWIAKDDKQISFKTKWSLKEQTEVGNILRD